MEGERDGAEQEMILQAEPACNSRPAMAGLPSRSGAEEICPEDLAWFIRSRACELAVAVFYDHSQTVPTVQLDACRLTASLSEPSVPCCVSKIGEIGHGGVKVGRKDNFCVTLLGSRQPARSVSAGCLHPPCSFRIWFGREQVHSHGR